MAGSNRGLLNNCVKTVGLIIVEQVTEERSKREPKYSSNYNSALFEFTPVKNDVIITRLRVCCWNVQVWEPEEWAWHSESHWRNAKYSRTSKNSIRYKQHQSGLSQQHCNSWSATFWRWWSKLLSNNYKNIPTITTLRREWSYLFCVATF